MKSQRDQLPIGLMYSTVDSALQRYLKFQLITGSITSSYHIIVVSYFLNVEIGKCRLLAEVYRGIFLLKTQPNTKIDWCRNLLKSLVHWSSPSTSQAKQQVAIQNFPWGHQSCITCYQFCTQKDTGWKLTHGKDPQQVLWAHQELKKPEYVCYFHLGLIPISYYNLHRSNIIATKSILLPIHQYFLYHCV